MIRGRRFFLGLPLFSEVGIAWPIDPTFTGFWWSKLRHPASSATNYDRNERYPTDARRVVPTKLIFYFYAFFPFDDPFGDADCVPAGCVVGRRNGIRPHPGFFLGGYVTTICH